MRPALLKKSDYQKAAQLFHWATSEHYRLWFTGKTAPHKRTAVMLPRLVKNKELVAMSYEGRLVYAAKKYCKGVHFLDLIEHGLGCTEGLVRLWRSDRGSYITPEAEFKGMGSVPEWGLVYEKSMLLYEFCTQDNFRRHKVESKITQYRQSLPVIEERFKRKAMVVFVVDALRPEIKELSLKFWEDPCYFTDYETFKSVPMGEQLVSRIYLWGGEAHSLRHEPENS